MENCKIVEDGQEYIAMVRAKFLTELDVVLDERLYDEKEAKKRLKKLSKKYNLPIF